MDESPDWAVFRLDEVRARRGGHGRPWEEFLRVADLYAGLYEIPVGGTDRQSPHQSDEVYHVVSGRGTFVVGDERTDVGPGTVLYVARDVEHRFVDIEQDLSILVFFATP